jgi:hypothetical protein
MGTYFHPSLFNAEAFERSTHSDIYECIAEGWVEEDPYGWHIDGYDIISVGAWVDSSGREYTGSIVDFLVAKLPIESSNNMQAYKAVKLLRKLTWKFGNLYEKTEGMFYGYLSGQEVKELHSLLQQCFTTSEWTASGKVAMIKILAIATKHNSGLLYSCS